MTHRYIRLLPWTPAVIGTALFLCQPQLLVGQQVAVTAKQAARRDLAHYYHYDSGLPFNAAVLKQEPIEGGSRLEIRIDGADGEPIPATLLVPNGKGPYAVHMGSPREVGGPLVNHNVLTVSTSVRLDGQRQRTGLNNGDGTRPGMVLWARLNTVIDFRRLLDYVLSEYPITEDRVFFTGSSRLGRIGVVLMAVEPRINASVVRVCGADFGLHVDTSGSAGKSSFAAAGTQPWYSTEFFNRVLAPIDPQHFAHLIAPRPILCQFGRADQRVLAPHSQRLVELLGNSKTVIWYDGLGHRLQSDRPPADARDWLNQQLALGLHE